MPILWPLLLGLSLPALRAEEQSSPAPDVAHLRELLLDRNNPRSQSQAALLLVRARDVEAEKAVRDPAVLGIDTAVPDKVLQMPPCDPRDPSDIPASAQPYMKLAPTTQLVSVELTYRDGSVSEIKSFRTANRSN